jgi:hypothetical protein
VTLERCHSAILPSLLQGRQRPTRSLFVKSVVPQQAAATYCSFANWRSVPISAASRPNSKAVNLVWQRFCRIQSSLYSFPMPLMSQLAFGDVLRMVVSATPRLGPYHRRHWGSGRPRPPHSGMQCLRQSTTNSPGGRLYEVFWAAGDLHMVRQFFSSSSL